MGQQLYEPPDVNGWALGPEWFSTASMLSRMNFAATLMADQRNNLPAVSAPHRGSPEALLEFNLARYSHAPYAAETTADMLAYLRQGGVWTGSDTQLANKGAGLGRLIIGSAEYQFN